MNREQALEKARQLFGSAAYVEEPAERVCEVGSLIDGTKHSHGFGSNWDDAINRAHLQAPMRRRAPGSPRPPRLPGRDLVRWLGETVES